MPLYPVSSQPYFLDPNAPKREDCIGDYYYPVIPSDEIFWQGFQTPCGIDITEDPTFENFTLGAELLTNGIFAVSLAPWGSTGTWAYGVNNAVYTGSVGGGDLSQGIAISIGDLVQVEFTVSGLFNGSPMEVYLGTTLLAEITDPGDYTLTGVYGAGSAEILFSVPVGSAIASLALDDVSAKVFTQTDWNGNGEWAFSDGFACKQIAGTGMLTNIASNYIVSGNRYRITFTLSGNTEGSILVGVGGTFSTGQSGNGIKTVWINATGNGVLEFDPSLTFTGCISEIDVREMKRASDFTWQIISELGEGDVYDLSDYVDEYEDFLTMIYDPQDDDLPEGCYIMRIFDSCSVQYDDMVANPTFLGGTTTSVPDWFRNNTGNQYDFSANNAEFIFDPLGGEPNLVTNGDFSAGLGSWTAGAGWSSAGGGALHTAGSTATLSQDVAIVGTAGPTARTQWVQFTISGRTAGSIAVSLGNSASTAFTINDVITLLVSPTVFGSIPITFTPTTNFDGTIDDVTVVELTGELWVKFPSIRNTANPLFVPGNYEAEFEIISNDDTTNIGVAVTINGILATPSYQKTVGVHTVSLPGYTGAATDVRIIASFTDLTTGNGYPGSIVVDNVHVYRVEPFEATYTSENIDYHSGHENTSLIRAYNDQNSFGYEFVNTGYYLQQRMAIRSMNEFEESETQIALSGNGSGRLYYSEAQYYWIVATDYMDASAHKALSIQLKCNHLLIGDTVSVFKEYLPTTDEYRVDWRPAGDYNLATSQFAVRIKDGGQIFNREI